MRAEPPRPASARPPRGTWRSRLVAALVSGLVCIGLCEVGLRAVLGERLAPFYEEDPACLYRLIPGSGKPVKRPPDDDLPGPILVRVNQDGFRGPDLRASGERRRVLVYGDSCVLAIFSDYDNTYPARLGEELGNRLPGRPFEVVNAGTAGYGPDQVALRMEKEVGRYRPELVIVALFADNDMGDILRNRIFRLDDRGRLVRNRPVLSPALAGRLRGARGWVIPKAVGRALERLHRASPHDSAAPGEGPMDALLRLRREEYEEYVRGERVVRNLFKDGYDADVSCEPESDAARLKIALLSGIVGRMAETCRRAGVPLVMVVIPTPADVCRDAPGYDAMRVDPARYPSYDPRALTNAMAGAARERGVPCLAFFDAFAAAEDPKGLYHHGDDHWNDSGQALAARLTADFLLERGLLP